MLNAENADEIVEKAIRHAESWDYALDSNGVVNTALYEAAASLGLEIRKGDMQLLKEKLMDRLQ